MQPERSPWMTEELDMFRTSARRFVETELVTNDERFRKAGMVDRETWSKAGDIGLLCPDIPEAYGGPGGTFAYDAVVLEELGYGCVTSLGTAVHSIVAHYINGCGTQEQKLTWLPKMVTGELVGAIAMSEPHAGSDLQAIRTRAIREGDDYVINGSKTFITNGYHADLICVVAKTNPDEGAKGTSLIMLETKNLPGFRVGRLLDKVGAKGNDTVELFFDDVRVPARNVLGPAEGQGFYQLMDQLPRERVIIAVSAVAALERAVEITTDYVKERKAFGKTLMEFQNTRFKLAECKTEAKLARVFLDQCIDRLEQGALDTATAAMLKYWTTDKQCSIIDECVQLHGGYGFMMEYPIARMYADARVQRIYGGSNEIMKELIARSL